MIPSLKARLAAGDTVVGSWLTFDYTATAEFLARAGFDFLVVDMEHTAITAEGQWRLIQTVELAGTVPLVRVGANDPLLIKQALDAGAHGILIPMISSREEAERAVAAAYYPPKGTRGVGLWRAQNYGAGFEAYRARAARETVVIPQVEHYRGVEALSEILGVDGVDGFMIGPYDLSGSLGTPGDFENPRFLECLAEVERLAKSHPKAAGYHVVHPDPEGRAMQLRRQQGYRFLVCGTDMIFYTSKVDAEVGRLRAGGFLRSPAGPSAA